MKTWTRREFGGLAGASLLAALGPKAARGQAKPRVVVIGGGIGGATVARYLASGTPAIDVTLVEPKERYITCFFSNLYLAGLRSLDSLSHGYQALAEKYGITVIHESAAAIDPASQDGRAAERRAALLRPARACSGHRLQVRRNRGLRRGGDRNHAACLECRAAERAAAPAAGKHGGRRRFRDRRSAGSRSAVRRPPTSARRWSRTISSSTSRSRRS